MVSRSTSEPGARPQLVVEDLDLDRARCSRPRRRPATAGAGRRSRRRAGPGRCSTPSGSGVTQSASWKRGDPAARPGAICAYTGRPTTRGRCRPPRRPGRPGEPLGEVERLGEGGDHAAVGGEHRVQRLDRQPDAGGRGVRGQRARSRRRPAAGRRRGPGCRPAARRRPAPAWRRPARPPRRWPAGCRRAASPGRAVKKPPRHRVVTVSPASRTSRAVARQAVLRRPVRATARRRATPGGQRSRRPGRAVGQPLAVAWLNGERGAR